MYPADYQNGDFGNRSTNFRADMVDQAGKGMARPVTDKSEFDAAQRTVAA
jgi:hypothetical protein